MRRAAALGLALGCAACSRPQPPAAPATARNLLLVSIDTLRADRLGCYGSSSVATPRLDGLARQGAFFPEASAHVPLTRPSHASMLTGRLPAEHGLRDNVAPPLDASLPTLAEILKAAGFRTGGFVSSIVLLGRSGFGRGFETYADRFEAGADDVRFLNTIQKRGDVTVAEAQAWLEAGDARRFFAFVHLYDPHDPYEPPEPHASRYAQQPYDGEVAFADELVGRLDDLLARLGRRDDTLVVVTSDHGEGLGEHGESVHGFFVYQSTLRVPLVLRGPGVKPGVAPRVTARTIDILPTVLELLDVARPSGLQLSGRSLAPALRGEPAPREEPVLAESLLPRLHYGWSELHAFREGRFKYIEAPRPELYDLADDPHEQRNLLASQPARAEALRQALQGRRSAEPAAPLAIDPSAASGELLESLGALGYVGVGRSPDSPDRGADPKDKLEDYKLLNRLMREGLIALREQDARGASRRFERLLGRGVDSFEAHYYLGRALLAQRRLSEAERQFAAAAERLPAYGPAYLSLADCRLARGDLGGARAALQLGIGQSPRDVRLRGRLAAVWLQLGQPAEAVSAYEGALQLEPQDALLHVQLGEALRDAGRPLDAERELRRGVELQPEVASYWNALGMLQGAQGKLAEAEGAFRAALERDDRNAQYAFNLGLALERQGRRPEAAEAFRKALELDPRFTPARQRLAATRAN